MFFLTPVQEPTSTWRSSMNVCHTVSNHADTPSRQPHPLASPVPLLHLPNPTPPEPRPLNQLLPSTHTHSLTHSCSVTHTHTHECVLSLLHALTHAHLLHSLSLSYTHTHTHSLSHFKPFFSIDSATFQRLREIFTSGRCFVHKQTHKPGQISIQYPQRCADSAFIGDHKHTNTLVHSLTQ